MPNSLIDTDLLVTALLASVSLIHTLTTGYPSRYKFKAHITVTNLFAAMNTLPAELVSVAPVNNNDCVSAMTTPIDIDDVTSNIEYISETKFGTEDEDDPAPTLTEATVTNPNNESAPNNESESHLLCPTCSQTPTQFSLPPLTTLVVTSAHSPSEILNTHASEGRHSLLPVQ